MKMKSVCIIPARAGSKRIPDKNIKIINGQPALTQTINLVREVDQIRDNIFVSTDSRKYYELAVNSGAVDNGHLRPQNLSDDHTGTLEVIQAYLSLLLSKDCISQNTIVFVVYPLAFFINSEELNAASRLFESRAQEIDFLISAKIYDKNPLRSFMLRDAELQMLFPEMYSARSQDLPTIYFDAGQFYIGSVATWMKATKIYTSKSQLFTIDRPVVDIDTQDDWFLAENLLAK